MERNETMNKAILMVQGYLETGRTAEEGIHDACATLAESIEEYNYMMGVLESIEW